MAETKKTYRVYINQDSASFETAAGSSVGVNRPELYLGNYFIFQADVKNDDGSAFEFPPDALFFASLNTSLGQDDPDEAAALTADFNQAEQWSEVDLSSGKISWEMNTLGATLQTDIAAKTKAKVWLELWFKEAAGNYSKILHEQLVIYNSGSDFDPVEVPEIEYASTEDLAAKVSNNPADANFRFKDGASFQIFNPTTGKFHDVWLEGADGSADLKWAANGEA